MRDHKKLDPIDGHALLPAQFGMPASERAKETNYLTLGPPRRSAEGRGLWILLLLLTPIIPAFLLIYASLGFAILTGPSIARKLDFVAVVKHMYGAYHVSLWLLMMGIMFSWKITVPATGVLLLLHGVARWVGWNRWWLYAMFGFAIGVGAAALWPVGDVLANGRTLAPLGAAAGLYFWLVLYGSRMLRWCVLVALLPVLAAPLVLVGHWIARALG